MQKHLKALMCKCADKGIWGERPLMVTLTDFFPMFSCFRLIVPEVVRKT